MPGHMVHLVVHHDHHQKYQEQVYWVDQLNLVHIDIMIHVIVNHNHLFIIFWKDHVDGKHLSIIFACKFCFFFHPFIFFLSMSVSHFISEIFLFSVIVSGKFLFMQKKNFMLKMFWQKKNFLGNQIGFEIVCWREFFPIHIIHSFFVYVFFI